jgi:hypothetical protein
MDKIKFSSIYLFSRNQGNLLSYLFGWLKSPLATLKGHNCIVFEVEAEAREYSVGIYGTILSCLIKYPI